MNCKLTALILLSVPAVKRILVTTWKKCNSAARLTALKCVQVTLFAVIVQLCCTNSGPDALQQSLILTWTAIFKNFKSTFVRCFVRYIMEVWNYTYLLCLHVVKIWLEHFRIQNSKLWTYKFKDKLQLDCKIAVSLHLVMQWINVRDWFWKQWRTKYCVFLCIAEKWTAKSTEMNCFKEREAFQRQNKKDSGDLFTAYGASHKD